MGFTYVEVTLYNPARLEAGEKVALLVDSGAIYTCLPAELLKKLGIEPLGKWKFKVFGGQVIERWIGGAMIEYEGRRVPIPVIFGEPGDTPVLGVTTLETLGYELDPVTKKLKPVELLMV